MVSKCLVLVAFVAIAMQCSLALDHPSSFHVNPGWIKIERGQFTEAPTTQTPAPKEGVLIRRARSPQGGFEGRFEQDGRGSRANLDYRHQINKDLDVYASGRRDFSLNDNSAHVGVNWRF